MSEHRIGDVARRAGVSVRTLRHYDEIGLLPPSGRSEAGYRLYSAADLERLRRILFYRELDFGLEQIAQILADPEASTDDHLRRQHRLLRERRERDAALLTAIEHEMEARQMGISLTPEEQLEVFGTTAYADHAEEAERRWADTDAWKESQRRAAAYTKDDWVAIKREADASMEAFAEALRAGEPASGTVAMDLAEAHREHLSRWFYACSPAYHRALAELYVSDARFAATYEEIAPGLSRFVRDAINANADRAGAADG
ncbi:MAG TPA: MerR family transcriptional regulator [Conexibacter sp.]|nr:MerR family transcriptional regulator [Conexibacter sp.]